MFNGKPINREHHGQNMHTSEGEKNYGEYGRQGLGGGTTDLIYVDFDNSSSQTIS